jgi:hypothetical protein
VNFNWYRFLNDGGGADGHHWSHPRGRLRRTFGFPLAAASGQQGNSGQGNGRDRLAQGHSITSQFAAADRLLPIIAICMRADSRWAGVWEESFLLAKGPEQRFSGLPRLPEGATLGTVEKQI